MYEKDGDQGHTYGFRCVLSIGVVSFFFFSLGL